MSKSQVEIVQNAERLAANLQAGPVVTKNALLSVVATFMSDPAGDLDRLRRTMTLLEKGSGGHLKRGGGFGDQVRMVIREVGRVLDRGEWQPVELKSLFGWTARLLQVRQAPRKEKEWEPRGAGPDHRSMRPSGRPSRPDRRLSAVDPKEPSPQPTKPLGALSGKNLDALKALSDKLSKPKGEKP
jgi:hypothetical protein